MVIERLTKPFGRPFEIRQHIKRGMSGHDGRDEYSFSNPPLGYTDGFLSVNEDFARPPAREAHETKSRIALEWAIVHRDVARDKVLESLGPPPTRHSRTRMHVTTPAIIARRNPPINPQVVSLQQHQTAATSTSPQRDVTDTIQFKQID